MFNYAVLNYNNYSTENPGDDVGYVTNINPDNAADDVYYSVGNGEYNGGNYLGVLARIDVLSSNSTVLFEAGNDCSFSFNGIVYTNNANSFNVARVDYYFRYADGTNSGNYIQAPNSSVTYEGYFANSLRETFKVSLNFNPQKDVTRVWIRVFFRLNNGPSNRVSYNIGYGNPHIDIAKQGNNNSILATIRDWLGGIYNTLVNTVSDSLTDIVNVINNIYTTISSRLSSVVNYLNNIYNAIFNTLSDKLTQIIDIIVGTETEPGLVGHITNFFSNFINTVINFIRGDWALPSLDPLKDNLEQYYEDEDNLFSQFSEHVDEFGNVLNNAEQRFGNARGILAVSNMLTFFIRDNSFLSMLLWFSLALGIISFILGTSWLVGKFTSQR